MVKFAKPQLMRAAAIGLAAVLILLAAGAPGVRADEGVHSSPRVTGWARLQTEVDTIFDAEDRDDELTVAFLRGDAELSLRVNSILSFHTYLFLEPIRGTAKDSFFEDHGLYPDELYARLTFGDWKLFAGKFEALFGRVTDYCYGIYCSEFAFKYQIVERVGFGTSYSRSSGTFGDIKVTASTYFLDTSLFSDSLFASRGQTSVADGGVSNTESFESFAVALEGNRVFGLNGVDYQLAYRHQAQGEGPFDVSDENGYLAGLYWKREIGPVVYDWIAEGVYLDGAEGTNDELWYGTLAVRALLDKYYLAASYTARPRNIAGTSSDLDDWLVHLTGGVLLGDGWYSEVGYNYKVDFDEESHTFGVVLAKIFNVDGGLVGQTIPQRRPASVP